LNTTRDSAGTDALSGQSPLEGLRASRSNRFIARIRKYTGQDSSSRRDSGAAIVEMAFIFTLLVMLLVGTVTAAVAFGRNNSIENAAREASRYAATLPSSATWFQDVRDVARNAALGELDSSVPGQYICVAQYNGTSWTLFTDTGGVPAGPTSGLDCFSDGLPPDQPRVQIVTSRDTNINAVMFNIDVTLSGQASARYER
jgi:hypothetical protein